MNHSYFPMPTKTREAFERFVAEPAGAHPADNLALMVQYLQQHGVHSVYCKVKEFMPKHYAMIKAASTTSVDK